MSFAEAMNRLHTDPGVSREELPALAEGIVRLACDFEVLRTAPEQPELASSSLPDGLYWIES